MPDDDFRNRVLTEQKRAEYTKLLGKAATDFAAKVSVLEAEVFRLRAAIQAAVDGCQECDGTGTEAVTGDDCLACRGLRAATERT